MWLSQQCVPVLFNTSFTLQFSSSHLKGIRQSNVLSGQFEKHRVVEEFVDRDVFTETLTTASLHHELACQMRCGLRL